MEQMTRGGWKVVCKSNKHAIALKEAIKTSEQQRKKEIDERVKVKIPAGRRKEGQEFYIELGKRYNGAADFVMECEEMFPELAIIDMETFSSGFNGKIRLQRSVATDRINEEEYGKRFNVDYELFMKLRKWIRKTKCSQCLRWGHHRTECTEKQMRCRKCGQFGHTGSACTASENEKGCGY